MTRYNINYGTIDIEGEVYRLSPLSGEYYADFMAIATKMDEVTKAYKKANPNVPDSEIPLKLDREDFKLLADLITESLMIVDTTAKREEVAFFASQNLMKLFPVLLDVNLPRK